MFVNPVRPTSARERISDGRATFQVADARSLPFTDGRFDVVVSGLVLNFIPSPEQGLAEMVRVTRSGGVVASYAWDYAGQMQLIRHFWDAAVRLDPAALDLDEGRRFPLMPARCARDTLPRHRSRRRRRAGH